MIALAFAELRQDPRVWLGPLLVSIVAAGFVFLAAVYWWTLGTPAGASLIQSFGSTVEEARAGSYVVYVSTAVPAVAVLGTTSAATVTALTPRVARWRLAGALPRQVRGVVTIQVLIVNALGTILGVLGAIPFCQLAVDVLVRMVTRADHTIPAGGTIPAGLLAFVGSTLVCALASFIPARRASRISAVHAVRDAEESNRAMTVSRWIVAGLLTFALLQQIVVTIGATLTLSSAAGGASGATTLAMMTGMIAIAAFAAYAPALIPFLIRCWTSAVPARWAPAWFIARHVATSRPRAAAAAVMPITVGIGLYGILFGIVATWQNALTAAGSSETLNTVDTYVILTPAAAIAITGSIASVLLSTRHHARDHALIRVAGAAPRTIIGTAIAEAIAYGFTAIVIAFLVTTASVATAAVMLTSDGLPAQPIIDMRQMLTLSGIGTLGLLVVLLIPAITAIRGNPRETISAI